MRKWFARRAAKAQRDARRLRPLLEVLEDRLAPAVITVTTTSDDLTPNDGSVSLREALSAINAGSNLGDPDIVVQNPGPFGTGDTIHFAIAGSAPFQIDVGTSASALGAPLPQITTPVLVDGTSQPGFAGKPLIVLNGANAGPAANGLDIELGTLAGPASGLGVTVQGLVINQFGANGIQIGANAFSGFGTVVATITGNYIGTDATGIQARANGGNGIFIDGLNSDNTGTAASNNLIRNNVISGNQGDGVLIQANANGVAAGNRVEGNRIGTNAAGMAALPNGTAGSTTKTGNSGVEIISASGNTVGGSTEAARNILSGNLANGVHIAGTLTDPASANSVTGNYVGVAVSGSTALGNARFGIQASGASASSIGGNVVGSNGVGIGLDDGASRNFVQGNFVGVGADSVTPVGNQLQGIVLRSDGGAAPPLGPGQPNEPGVQNNMIGGKNTGEGNTVAFNNTGGVAVYGNPVSLNGAQNAGNAIEGNSIYQNGRSAPSGNLLGIDLSNGFPFPKDDGETANDAKGHGAANDPNNFQNAPDVASLSLVGGVTIGGTLTEAKEPNTVFRLEFFASNFDPFGLPAEGQFFLGAAPVTTDASGKASFTFTFAVPLARGQAVTATATSVSADPSAPVGQPAAGNTSEFSLGQALFVSLNEYYVVKLYQELLHRTVDALGLVGWTGMLDGGVTPLSVVQQIQSSLEYQGVQVQAAYSLLLHRAPSDLELSIGTGDLRFLHESLEVFDASLAAMPEYLVTRSGGSLSGYVNAVYQDAFGTPNRVASDPGAAVFVTMLSSNTITASQFTNAIFTSNEYHTDLVQSYYSLFLNRSGSPAEIQAWANLLNQGQTDQFISAAILASAESVGKLLPGGAPLGLGTASSPLPGLGGPSFSNIPLDGSVALTNLYVFRSPGDTAATPNFGNTVLAVTLSPFAGVLTPLSFPAGLSLDLNVVDTAGHLTPDFTFRLTFGTPTPAGNTFDQVVTLRLLQGNTTTTIAQYTYAGNQTIPPAAFPNNVTFPGDAIATGKFIAGVFDDPFFMDASGFSAFAQTGANPLNLAHPFPRLLPLDPAQPSLTEATNSFRNANTLGFVLELPTTKLTTANPRLIGAWATSAVNGTQVARVGRPLIDDLLIPPVPRNDLSRGDRRTAFEEGSPASDVANFRADMISVLTSPNFIYRLTPTQAANLVDKGLGTTVLGTNTGLLPDMLTVDLSKLYTDPNGGLFNGRRLRDDAANILLALASNQQVTTDNVPEDNGAILTDGLEGSSIAFPYLGRPNNPPGGPNP